MSKTDWATWYGYETLMYAESQIRKWKRCIIILYGCKYGCSKVIQTSDWLAEKEPERHEIDVLYPRPRKPLWHHLRGRINI